jgi:mitochondrial fission protein ELM1
MHIRTETLLVMSLSLRAKSSQLSVVILGNSFAGAENQCWGLLEQLQLKAQNHEMKFNVEVRRILPTKNWIHLPPSLHILASGFFKQWTWIGLTEKGNTNNANENFSQSPIQRSYPDVVIASGRTTVPACVAYKRASQGRTFTVQIQHPRCDLRYFDAVVVPQHDLHRQTGGLEHQQKLSVSNESFQNGMSNVIATLGSIHRVNSESIRQGWVEDRHILMPFISSENAKVVTVLIGGPTPHCRWDTKSLLIGLDNFFWLLQQNQSKQGSGNKQKLSVLISLSRRSPPNLLKDLKAWENRTQTVFCPSVFIWDPSVQCSANPYRAMLYAADLIAVTADSVGMCSEACSTGKPVVTLLTHKCQGKFGSFHDSLTKGGYAVRAEDWSARAQGADRSSQHALLAPIHEPGAHHDAAAAAAAAAAGAGGGAGAADAGAELGVAGRVALEESERTSRAWAAQALQDTERVASLVLPRMLSHCRR